MIEPARPDDMDVIRACVERFRLDGEDLRHEQFLVKREAGRVVAFGRIKPYARAYELGCVGVVEDARGQGHGKEIVEELVRRFPTPEVWITTDRPDWFARRGFRAVDEGPDEVVAKISRVCHFKPGVVLMVRAKG